MSSEIVFWVMDITPIVMWKYTPQEIAQNIHIFDTPGVTLHLHGHPTYHPKDPRWGLELRLPKDMAYALGIKVGSKLNLLVDCVHPNECPA